MGRRWVLWTPPSLPVLPRWRPLDCLSGLFLPFTGIPRLGWKDPGPDTIQDDLRVRHGKGLSYQYFVSLDSIRPYRT